MNWCDAVVVPSKKPEPFGRVAIEAMAAKRPVMASNHGGLTEIVVDGETGLLCAANNPAAFAQAIKHLYNNPEERIMMAKKGYERFDNLFTEPVYIKNMQAIIRQLNG